MTSLKRLATPLAIGTFFIMSVTGILMFFHFDVGLNKPLHEWFGWAFLAAVLLHAVLVHKKALLNYFQKKPARIIFCTSAALLALSFVQIGETEKHPYAKTADIILTADLEDTGKLLGLTPLQITDGLKAQGLQIEGEAQSLFQIAAANHTSDRELLGRVLDIAGK